MSPAHAGPSDVADAAEARSAVLVGVHVSAVRCILTYVVAPLLGAAGFVLGPLGLVLQLLGAVTSIGGARRLWALDHRGRVPYAVIALVITLLTVATTIQFLHEVLP